MVREEKVPAPDSASQRASGKKEDKAGPKGDRWDDDNDGRFDGGDFASLEAELFRLEGQMRLAGVPLPPVAALGGVATGATPSVTPADQALQCTKACELTEAICALSVSICEMGKRHPGEDRYAAACERSKKDCELGTKTCEGCSN